MQINLYTLDVLSNYETLMKPYRLQKRLWNTLEVIGNNPYSKHLSNYTWTEYYTALTEKQRYDNRELNKIIYDSIYNDYRTVNDYLCCVTDNEQELFKALHQVDQAYIKRVVRLKDRIRQIVECPNAYFVTLTFNDDTLATTSPQTRHAYVKRFLNAYASNYVGNIDYGKQNGREHYHAVLNADEIENFFRWDIIKQYGYVKIQPIERKENDSVISLAKYVSKLTNHAIKETTKSQRIMYSRC